MSEEVSAGRTVSALKKNGKLWIALVGLLIGAGLLLAGGLAEEKAAPETSSDATREERVDIETYRREVEARIRALCACVDGVGDVTVAVSLEGGYAYVYATDVKDTAGGMSTQYILVGNGSDEHPVYITQQVPVITGIGVVCGGGSDPAVCRELVSLLSAAFGVGSHKIYVTGGG